MSSVRPFSLALLCAALAFSSTVPAQAQAVDPVVATRSGVSVTLSELDAGVRKVPEDMRGGYMRDATRVARLIDNLLTAKQIASKAREEGLDKEPAIAADIAMAKNEILAREFLDRQTASEADEAALEQLALQTYRANPERFKTEPVWDISYLLASTDGRDEAAAKQLAEDLLKRARAGEDLETLIKDATATQSSPNPPAGGSIKGADLLKMDTDFVVAVKSIKAAGEWSEPVRTRFGFHIARLDRFEPIRNREFADVKEELVAELRAKAEQNARTALIRSFSLQDTALNDEVIAALRTRYATPVDAADDDGSASAPSDD